MKFRRRIIGNINGIYFNNNSFDLTYFHTSLNHKIISFSYRNVQSFTSQFFQQPIRPIKIIHSDTFAYILQSSSINLVQILSKSVFTSTRKSTFKRRSIHPSIASFPAKQQIELEEGEGGNGGRVSESLFLVLVRAGRLAGAIRQREGKVLIRRNSWRTVLTASPSRPGSSSSSSSSSSSISLIPIILSLPPWRAPRPNENV